MVLVPTVSVCVYVNREWCEDEIAVLRHASTLLPDRPPLTADEVSRLPDGAKVIIRWGGGNGPHRYEIEREKDGTLWALSDRDRRGDHRWEDPMWPALLTSYGRQRWNSMVWVDE